MEQNFYKCEKLKNIYIENRKQANCGIRYFQKRENYPNYCDFHIKPILRDEKRKLRAIKLLEKQEKQKLRKPRKTKIELLKNWLDEQNISYVQAKTTKSLYIMYEFNDFYKFKIKISNHQLITCDIIPFENQSGKEIMKADSDINLKIIKDINCDVDIKVDYIYDFREIEYYKYHVNYDSDVISPPDFWIPIFGNYQIERLKNVITDLIYKIKKDCQEKEKE